MTVCLLKVVFMSAKHDLVLDSGAGSKTVPVLRMTSLSMSNW